MTTLTAAYPNWSRTGDYIYFLHQGDQPSVMRVRIRDRKPERVADLKDFPQAGYVGYWLEVWLPTIHLCCFATWAPRKSYALDWEALSP